MGTGLTNVIKEHFLAYQKLFELDGIRPNAWSDNPDIQVVERFGDGYAYLFIFNCHKMEHLGVIHYTDPSDNMLKKLTRKGTMVFPANSSLVVAINVPLGEGVGRIVASTNTVVETRCNRKQLGFTLADAFGKNQNLELQLNCRPKKITLDGKPIEFHIGAKHCHLKFEGAEKDREIEVYL